MKQSLSWGATIEYINHANYHQFNYTKEFNQYQYRQAFNDADIILVNGNHFEAKCTGNCN